MTSHVSFSVEVTAGYAPVNARSRSDV